jgi:hypothetical protein
MKTEFEELMQMFVTNYFSYWNKISFETNDKDYHLRFSNSKYSYEIEWFEKHTRIGKRIKVYILHFKEHNSDGLNMTLIKTGVFGEQFETKNDLIKRIYSFLKEDPIFIKQLRGKKLQRIV